MLQGNIKMNGSGVILMSLKSLAGEIRTSTIKCTKRYNAEIQIQIKVSEQREIAASSQTISPSKVSVRPTVNSGLKTLDRKLLSFRLCTILRSVVKSYVILTWDMNLPFTQ